MLASGSLSLRPARRIAKGLQPHLPQLLGSLEVTRLDVAKALDLLGHRRHPYRSRQAVCIQAGHQFFKGVHVLNNQRALGTALFGVPEHI
jgi:hypothetical protein